MNNSFSPRMKPRRKARRTEQTLQVSLVRVLSFALTAETAFFHVGNGGYRTYAEAGIFRAMGVKAGVPDLVFIHAGHAFGLELKSDEGQLSIAQRAMQAELREAGMRIETVRSVDEALERLREMGVPLKIKRREMPAALREGAVA